MTDLLPSSDLLGDARARLTDIRAAAADVDDTRTLSPAATAILKDLGTFRLLAPRSMGGQESDPLRFFDLIEELSYADGSVGWCAMLGGCYATFGGMLPPSGARELFGDPDTIAAGAFNPVGVAHEVDGGYRVSGRWSLGSGSCHATWFVGGAVVLRNGQPVMGPHDIPLMRELFFPASQTTIIDTWDSTGLRGTASHDYTVEDLFVPAERTVWFQEPPVETGPLYRMPPIAMFASFIGAVALGVGRHAVDELVALSQTKVPVLSRTVLADRPTAHLALGRAQATVDAGRTYLRASLDDLWRQVEAGHAPSLGDRGRLWTAAAHAGHTVLAAVDDLYTVAGADAVYRRSPLDRAQRDVRTAVQHVCLQQTNYETMGRHLVGRDALASAWGMDYRGEDLA